MNSQEIDKISVQEESWDLSLRLQKEIAYQLAKLNEKLDTVIVSDLVHLTSGGRNSYQDKPAIRTFEVSGG
jgi:hypothetical protein